MERDAYLLQLAIEDPEEEEQPEILSILREMRRLNLPYYPGTIRELPYIFRLELNAAIDAEIEYQNIKLTNARLKARFASNDSQNP